MIKESIHQEDITILNMDSPKDKVPNDMRQKLTKLKETDKSTIIFADIITLFLVINRIISRQNRQEYGRPERHYQLGLCGIDRPL